MFFSPESREFKKPVIAASLASALIITAFGTLFLGILPNTVLSALEKARDVIAIKK
jgi:NADH:ubiquinone oxidoreductase subunit 2 (subunit N)